MITGFAYILPTFCLHVFERLYVILAVTKLRFAVDKVTPRRQQSYASPSTKLRLDDHKVPHRRPESYVLTVLKYSIDDVKAMF